MSLALAAALYAQTPDGQAVYTNHCARCHETDKTGWAPKREVLAKLPPQGILATLHVALMSLAANITDAERIAVTSWLVGKPVDAFRIPDPARPEGFCGASPSPRPDLLVGPKWNGWAAGLTNSRFQPAEMVGIRAEQIPELKLKWAVGFPGAVAAFSQPVVGGGRIFVGSMNGDVYSLDPPAAAHIGFTKRRLPG